MTKEDKLKWEQLIKKYPERAGHAWELYVADKRKIAKPETYFNFALKRIFQEEKRYKQGLKKYIKLTQPTKEQKNA